MAVGGYIGHKSRTDVRRQEVIDMLWTIIGVLVVLWLLGFSFQVGGQLIHLLVVIALALLVFNLFTGRRVT
jgi:heme/copper-type cytochrome/quinol oxidase subunit 2